MRLRSYRTPPAPRATAASGWARCLGNELPCRADKQCRFRCATLARSRPHPFLGLQCQVCRVQPTPKLGMWISKAARQLGFGYHDKRKPTAILHPRPCAIVSWAPGRRPPARLGGTAPRAAAGLPQAVELGEGKLPELHEPLADSRIAATRTCADGCGTTAHVKQARTRKSRKKSIFKLQTGSTLGLRRCGCAFLGRDEVRQTEAQKEQREPRRGWSRLHGHAPQEENPGAISDLCAVVLPHTNTGAISNPSCKSHEPCSLDLGSELSRVLKGTTDIDPQTSQKRKDIKRRQHDRQADMTRTH